MGQKSTIAKLPEEMRRFIADKHGDGATILETCEALFDAFEISIPKSTMGRHLKKLDEVADQMRTSRHLAEALANKLGDKPGNDLTKLNIEVLHNLIFKASMAEDGQFLNLDAKDVMMLAAAAKSLVTAQKQDADLEAQIRKQIAADMKDKLMAAAKDGKAGASDQDILARIEDLMLNP